MSYRGYYINLDRSTQRRKHMEAQLTRFGLHAYYERFPAADGNVLGFKSATLNDGELGCFTSHYLLLQKNLNTDAYLHVIEDDAVLCKDSHRAIRTIIGSSEFEDYDIIFTNTSLSWESYPRLKQFYGQLISQWTRNKFAYSVIDYVASTSSYIIRPSSICSVFDILEEALVSGTSHPIDIVIKTKAREGRIRVGCIFPFVTSVLIGDVPESMSRKGRDAISELAYSLAQASFFVERDLEKLNEYCRAILSGVERDSHADLLAGIYRFALSGKLQRF